MKFNSRSFMLTTFFVFISACSTVNVSKAPQNLESSENKIQKHQLSCTATQGLQSVDLPILTTGKEVGKIYSQKPLRLQAKPFDILFSAIDTGTNLQLSIQAATDKQDQAMKASYWGPYPTEKMHIELSRYAATISCF